MKRIITKDPRGTPLALTRNQYMGTLLRMFTFPEIISSICLDEVKQVVKKYLHRDNRTIIIANPIENYVEK